MLVTTGAASVSPYPWWTGTPVREVNSSITARASGAEPDATSRTPAIAVARSSSASQCGNTAGATGTTVTPCSATTSSVPRGSKWSTSTSVAPWRRTLPRTAFRP